MIGRDLVRRAVPGCLYRNLSFQFANRGSAYSHHPLCLLLLSRSLDYGMIEGTDGSPGGWMASVHISASGLLADIITARTSPAARGIIPCEMITSFAPNQSPKNLPENRFPIKTGL